MKRSIEDLQQLIKEDYSFCVADETSASSYFFRSDQARFLYGEDFLTLEYSQLVTDVLKNDPEVVAYNQLVIDAYL